MLTFNLIISPYFFTKSEGRGKNVYYKIMEANRGRTSYNKIMVWASFDKKVKADLTVRHFWLSNIRASIFCTTLSNTKKGNIETNTNK